MDIHEAFDRLGEAIGLVTKENSRLRAEVEALKALLRSRDDELFAREKEVEALQNNYYRLCLWAIDRRPDLPDHSCVECVPNSDLIIRDYRCAYHTAKTWAALAAGRE